MAGSSYQNSYYDKWEKAGEEGYDEPAQQYDQRLAAASVGEASAARDLWERNQALNEAQVRQQAALANRDVAGMGAGGGPAGLRAASYQQSQISQQAAGEIALQNQLAEQAYREQMMGVMGRRGEYGMAGQQFAGDMYSNYQAMEAYKAKKKAEEEAAEAEDDAKAVGMATGVAGGFLGAGI